MTDDSNEEPIPHVVHIVGMDVQVGPLRRQRCSWCGELLEEMDLSRVAWSLNEDGSDPGPPPMWEVGGLIGVSDGGGMKWAVAHEDGAQLPRECCASVPDDISEITDAEAGDGS